MTVSSTKLNLPRSIDLCECGNDTYWLCVTTKEIRCSHCDREWKKMKDGICWRCDGQKYVIIIGDGDVEKSKVLECPTCEGTGIEKY